MLDRRDVLDALPVDRSVEDLKLLPQLRVLGPLGEEVVGGHAELVVLDGDVEARVGQLGRERRPLVEQAGPDPRGLSGLGEGQRGGHGLRVVWRYFFGFFFFFLKWESRWREDHGACVRERERETEMKGKERRGKKKTKEKEKTK